MNGYQITLHTPTYHNGDFIGNIPDYVTIHAETEKAARAEVDLKPKAEYQVHEGLVITQDDQTIYSVRLLGRVVYRVVTDYEPY